MNASGISLRNGAPWVFGFINAIFGIVLFYDTSYFAHFKTFLLIFSFVTLLIFVNYFSYSFIFQLRLIFLSTIGYYAGIVKFIDPNLVFASFGISIQTFDIGVKMYGMTSISLMGSAIGFNMIRIRSKSRKFIANSVKIQWPIIFYLSGIFVAIVSYLSAKSYGNTIWEAAYASGSGEGQLLGNLQSLGAILLGINVLAAIKLNLSRYLLLSFIISIYFLFFGIFLRGGRLEFLSGLLVLYIGVPAAFGNIRAVKYYSYLVLIILAIFMEFWGHLRAVWSSAETETMLEGYLRMFDTGVFFAGTISGISSAFANVVDMIEKNVISYRFGVPYLEYFLRTPPEFLYPDRPKDLSSIFEDYGYISIGGFFEIAEAYLSFGLLGVFMIPLLISYLLAKIYSKAITGSLFFYIQLLAFLSVFMRGAWYQTFAYYKAFITGLIIYMAIVILIKLLNNLKPSLK